MMICMRLHDKILIERILMYYNSIRPERLDFFLLLGYLGDIDSEPSTSL